MTAPVLIFSQPAMFVGTTADAWLRFQALRKRWHQERNESSSSTTEICMTPAYQEIIGMGLQAVPLIIAQLRSEGSQPDHWFWALAAITGANPVPEEDAGRMDKMVVHWLSWYERSL